MYKTLVAKVMAQPEVRRQRVEELRQAIDAGEYTINGVDIADALLDDLVNPTPVYLQTRQNRVAPPPLCRSESG
jgi:cytidylate kinase